jgi:hypothetical protein
MSQVIQNALKTFPVVVVTGMRQVGKSTLLGKAPEFQNRAFATLDDFSQLEEAKSSPETFLNLKVPLTIDEAQRCPELLIAIKKAVDDKRVRGHFLLSGSSNFALLKNVSESLAGRAIYLPLNPFTRREISNASNSRPFLARFMKTSVLPKSLPDFSPISDREIYLGGMPEVCLRPTHHSHLWFKGFEQTYLERDIRGIEDPLGFRRLIRLAALRTGNLFSPSELARDAKLSAATAARYLGLLELSFIASRLPPFLNNRSSRLIKSPKLYLSDSGLACYLSGVSDERSLRPFPSYGALFETYVWNNLSAILAAHWPQASLSFWNVQGRHEVDFVIESGIDCWAVEVKAAERWETRDLAGLKAFLEYTPHSKAAILAYNGKVPARLGDKLWALPLGLLLS